MPGVRLISANVSLIGMDILLVDPEVGAIPREVLAIRADVRPIASGVTFVIGQVTKICIHCGFLRRRRLDARVALHVLPVHPEVLPIRALIRSVL